MAGMTEDMLMEVPIVVIVGMLIMWCAGIGGDDSSPAESKSSHSPSKSSSFGMAG